MNAIHFLRSAAEMARWPGASRVLLLRHSRPRMARWGFAMKAGVLQFFSWPERRVAIETVYERALERIGIMDRTGYDAVWLAEHHFHSFSVCPSVHMMGVHVASRTRRLRIGTAVSLAAFYHPLRLAEELAEIDMISRGRLVSGFVRGTGIESWATNTNPVHNRERFERHGLVQKFFERVVASALVEQYASNDHFTVDGTLIQSWASLKSFRPKDEPLDKPPSEGGSNPSVNFRGQKRTNETHRSRTDPEARLSRKSDGTPALLSHSGHALMENRHGLGLDIAIAVADGHAERDTAEKLLHRFRRRHGVKPKTVSGDRGFEAGEFLRTLEEDLRITPHVPITAERVTSPGPGGDARRRMLRRMRTKGYALSQRARKKIEQMFGWMKQAGGLRKVRHVGRWKIQQVAYLWAAAFNPLRLAHLEAVA